MNTKYATAAFGLAATMLLGAGAQSFAAETPPCCQMSAESERIALAAYEAYAQALSFANYPEDTWAAVKGIKPLALNSPKIAERALKDLIHARKMRLITNTTLYRDAESAQIIKGAIDVISKHWGIYPDTKEPTSMKDKLPATPPCCIQIP